METFSASLAICAGNSPVPGEFPAQRPVTRSFDVFFELSLNKRLGKQLGGWWFEKLSRPVWRHCNETTESIIGSWKVNYFRSNSGVAKAADSDYTITTSSSILRQFHWLPCCSSCCEQTRSGGHFFPRRKKQSGRLHDHSTGYCCSYGVIDIDQHVMASCLTAPSH